MDCKQASDVPTCSNSDSFRAVKFFRPLIRSCTVVSKPSPLKSSFNLDRISVLTARRKRLAHGVSFRSIPTRLQTLPDVASNTYVDIIKLRFRTTYENIDAYTDNYPLLLMRKALWRCKHGISEVSQLIISSQAFEYFIILVILMNTLILALTDPSGSGDTLLNTFDFTFLIIYSIEMGLKLLANGIGFQSTGYFRDYWNILDSIIVITGWIGYLGSSNVNLNSLRTLRILRPLRGISSISGLKVLFIALIASIRQLLASIFLLFVFLLIFAIAGLQLWSGTLTNQCVSLPTGENTQIICGDLSCPESSVCAKVLTNPQYGVTNFDNIFSSLLIVFQCVTLEGWTDVLFGIQKAFSRYAIVYFVVMTFVGAYLLVNLTLAVIKGAFTVAMDEVREKTVKDELRDEVVNSSKVAKCLKDIHEFRTSGVSEIENSEDSNSSDSEIAYRKKNSALRTSKKLKSVMYEEPSAFGRTITMRESVKYQRKLTNLGFNNK